MFDISWGEFMIIGAVALIVIGPKDLPKTLRSVGNAVGKLRRMAGDFQSQFSDAMREAELDEVRKQFQSMNDSVESATATNFNPIETIRNEIKGAIEPKKPADSALASSAGDASMAGPVADFVLEPPPVHDMPLIVDSPSANPDMGHVDAIASGDGADSAQPEAAPAKPKRIRKVKSPEDAS